MRTLRVFREYHDKGPTWSSSLRCAEAGGVTCIVGVSGVSERCPMLNFAGI